jgi:hypothetical protein
MLIHTIQIVGDIRVKGVVSATRKSDNRRYTACIVATTTERSLQVNADRKAKAQADLTDWRVKLAERTARHNGMTVEQAKTWERDTTDKWYGRDKELPKGGSGFDVGYWAALDQARKELNCRHGDTDKVRARATEIMVARGFADPYDKTSPAGIVEAAEMIGRLEESLSTWKTPVLGAQGVVSWHANVANASKSLSSVEYLTVREGKKLEIRTDIEIRETAKRAKKSA